MSSAFDTLQGKFLIYTFALCTSFDIISSSSSGGGNDITIMVYASASIIFTFIMSVNYSVDHVVSTTPFIFSTCQVCANIFTFLTHVWNSRQLSNLR